MQILDDSQNLGCHSNDLKNLEQAYMKKGPEIIGHSH